MISFHAWRIRVTVVHDIICMLLLTRFGKGAGRLVATNVRKSETIMTIFSFSPIIIRGRMLSASKLRTKIRFLPQRILRDVATDGSTRNYREFEYQEQINFQWHLHQGSKFTLGLDSKHYTTDIVQLYVAVFCIQWPPNFLNVTNVEIFWISFAGKILRKSESTE